MSLSMKTVNVFTEKFSSNVGVDIDDRIRLGDDQMTNFQKSLSVGFYDTLSEKMKTMADGKKSLNAGNKIRISTLPHINI